MLRIVLIVLCWLTAAFAEEDLASEIADGFKIWRSTQPPEKQTALCYAEYLAHEGNHYWAHSIIFEGAGFGGFAKRKANEEEMKQYYNVISLVSDPHSCEYHINYLGESMQRTPKDRVNILYHQAGMITLLSLINKNEYTEKGVSHALYDFINSNNPNKTVLMDCYDIARFGLHLYGGYLAHTNEKAKEMLGYLGNGVAWTERVKQKDINWLAVPMSCTYNHYYGFHGSALWLPDGRIVTFSDTLGQYMSEEEGNHVLFRPHYWIAYKEGVSPCGHWNENIHADIAYVDGTRKDLNGSCHIHDGLVSPNNPDEMSIGTAPMDKHFASNITDSRFPLKTLHMDPKRFDLVRSVDKLPLDVYGWLGLIWHSCDNEDEKDFVLKFMKDELFKG